MIFVKRTFHPAGQGQKLTMMQVPHHGSKHSYDQKVGRTKLFYNGFVNYDPYYSQHIFDENLPMKFAAVDKPLFLVTREYASQYEEYFKLV